MSLSLSARQETESTLDFVSPKNKPSLFLAKGMLSYDEFGILYSLGKGYRSEGIILDLGSFCGASAYCLGTGIKDSGVELTHQRPLHCFDLFENSNGRMNKFINHFFYARLNASLNLLPAETDECHVKSFRHIFDFQTSTVSQYLTVHAGSLLDIDPKNWESHTIEIANVDIAKSFELNEYIVKHVFPRVKPGGYVFQQDIRIPMNWYLLLSMFFLRNYVTLDFYTPHTGWLFRVEETITGEIANRCIHSIREMARQELMTSFDECLSFYPTEVHQCVRNCYAYCCVEKFGARSFANTRELLDYFGVDVNEGPAQAISRLCDQLKLTF